MVGLRKHRQCLQPVHDESPGFLLRLGVLKQGVEESHHSRQFEESLVLEVIELEDDVERYDRHQVEQKPFEQIVQSDFTVAVDEIAFLDVGGEEADEDVQAEVGRDEVVSHGPEVVVVVDVEGQIERKEDDQVEEYDEQDGDVCLVEVTVRVDYTPLLGVLFARDRHFR